MKLFNKILVSAVAMTALVMSSCSRELDAEIKSATPPSLQVVVKDAAGAALANTTVQVYADEATWNEEGIPMLTRQTDASGVTVVSKEELKEPGIFYLIARKDGLTAKAKTPYLLLNDGKTIFNVVVK